MNDRDAILAAVKVEPDDSFHRFAYADWLDDHGEYAQAKYLRWQLGVGDQTPPVSWRKWYAPWWPETAYRHHSPGTGIRHLRVFRLRKGAAPFEGFTVYRGFVDVVEMPLAVWDVQGRDLAERWPLSRVVLSDKKPWAARADDTHRAKFVWWRGDATRLIELPKAYLSEMKDDPRRIATPVDYDKHVELGCAGFATYQDAVEALSDALLRLARVPAK